MYILKCRTLFKMLFAVIIKPRFGDLFGEKATLTFYRKTASGYSANV